MWLKGLLHICGCAFQNFNRFSFNTLKSKATWMQYKNATMKFTLTRESRVTFLTAKSMIWAALRALKYSSYNNYH